MKQLARRSKTMAQKVPPKPIIRAAGTRTTHEYQAEESARRFVAGQTGLSSLLTKAPAAGFTLPSSPGVPLAAGIRSELETAFGADLSAVRIHRNAASEAATCSQKALAFTSGTAVYWSSLAGDPESGLGRQRLAHEVAHVLQQTGQHHGEAFKAIPRHSSGPIQRTPDTLAEYIAKRHITLDWLINRHQSGTKEAELDAVIEQVKTDLAGLNGAFEATTPQVADFEQSVLAKDSAYANPLKTSVRSRAFLFDCLKFLGCFDSASTLAKGRWDLKTACRYQPILDVYNQKYHNDYFQQVVTGNPVLKAYWPKRFYLAFQRYLFGPTRAIPQVELNGQTFLEATRDYFHQADQQALTDNEMVRDVFDTICLIDAVRIKKMEGYEAEAKRYFGTAQGQEIAWRATLAFKIKAWGKEIQGNAPPQATIWHMGAEIEKIGHDAAQFWLEVQRIQGLSLTKPQESTEGIRYLPNTPLLGETFPRMVVACGQILFSLQNDPYRSVPTIAAYAQQVLQAKQKLRRFMVYALELPLVAWISEQRDLALAVAFLITWILDFLHHLDTYQPAQDYAFMKKWPGRADLRIYHRYHAAIRLQNLVALVHGATSLVAWQKIQELATTVTTNQGQQRSELAILGQFEEEKNRPLEQMGKDFPKGIVNYPQLSTDHFLVLFKMVYYSKLIQTIKRLLQQPEEKEVKKALTQKPLLNRAVEAANEEAKPRRWHIPSDQWVFLENPQPQQRFPGEKEASEEVLESSAVFNYLFENHPKTREAVRTEEARGRSVLLPVEDAREIFFWSIPPLFAIIALLREDTTGLNQIIAEDTGRSIEEIHLLPQGDWLDKVVALGASRVTTALETRQAALYTELLGQMRQAVRLERKMLGPRLKSAMRQYTGRADATWDVPLNVLDILHKFGAWAWPEEDQKANMAALVLAMAADLLQVLKQEKRYAIITGYYGFVLLGAEYGKPEKKEELLRICEDEAEYQQLLQGRQALVDLRQFMDAVRKTGQKRFGFRSDGTNLWSLVYQHPIKANESFMIDGVKYRLIRVYRQFEYHPPYGRKPVEGSMPGEGGYKPPMMNGKEYGTEYRPSALPLFTINRDDKQITVTDRQTELLDLFSNVVEMRANAVAMEQLAENIETFVEFGMDVLELVPGLGQGFAAARMMTNIVQFLASGEFEDIRHVLSTEPQKILEETLAKVKEALTPENLLLFLLFGHPCLDFLKGKLESPRLFRVQANAGRSKSRMARVTSSVKNIKAGLAKRLDFLGANVQIPMRLFQAAIVTRPRLASSVRFLANNLYRAEEVRTTIRKIQQGAGSIAETNDIVAMMEGLLTNQEILVEHAQTILEGMGHIRLPERIIPTERIVDIVIELILKRLGRKGKGANLVLEQLGLRSEVSRMIAEAIADTKTDPNVYWRNEAIPMLEGLLEPAREALLEVIFGVLTEDFGLEIKKPEKGEKLKIDTEAGEFEPEEEFPETEPYPMAGGPRSLGHGFWPDRPGRPLPRSVQADAEWRFGHHFSHVRLHQDQETSQWAQSIGVLGLASGSHIHLRSGLDLTRNPGRRILHHELGHVLQQTGPQPLHRAAPTNPMWGAAGHGLGYDPSREAAADTLASRAAEGGHLAPLPVATGSRWLGLQPKLISPDTIKKILAHLSDINSLRQAQKEIDQLQGEAKISLEHKQAALAFWSEVWAQLTQLADLPQVPRLAEVQSELQTYLSNKKAEIDKAVPFIAMDSLVALPPKKGGKSGQLPDKRFDAKRFAGLMERYLMAKTGVVLTLHLSPDKDHPKVTRVTVTNLLLGLIGGGSPLWNKALANSGLHTDLDKLRPILRGALLAAEALLTVESTTPDGQKKTIALWNPLRFAFSNELVQYAQEMKTALATKGRPTDVPKAKQYVRDKAMTEPARELQIATHGVLQNRGQIDRRSHHTTQYVLIQYVLNQTNCQPFPPAYKAAWEKAGVAWNGKNPTRFVGPNPVEMHLLDTGARGDAMPAIYLARPTHEQGGLHIKGTAAEDEDDKRPTQSQTLHEHFTAALYTGPLTRFKSGLDKTWTDFVLQHRDLVNGQIFAALQSTYAMMYKHMMPALERALLTKELAYYHEIASAKHTLDKATPQERLDEEYNLQPSALKTVYTKAKANNDEIMGRKGWRSPM